MYWTTYQKDSILFILLLLLFNLPLRAEAISHSSSDTVTTTILGQVDVLGESISKRVKDKRMSFERLTSKDLKLLPSLMGDPDLVKILQLKSGVKSLGDGAIGMYIRGGGADQNILSIDDASVYNISHLCGLVSSFNTDVLGSINFYKGGAPANYGGRVSGVIDARVKNGDMYKPEFAIGLSSLYGNIYGSIPLRKGRSSIVFAARKSLPEYFGADKSDILGFLPTFFDANLKLNVNLGESDNISLSLFRSDDKMLENGSTTNYWNNSVSTFNWTHFYSDEMYSSISGVFSRYLNSNIIDPKNSVEWNTGVTDVGIKWKLQTPKYLFGLDIVNHAFIPGESNDTSVSLPRVNGLESAIYATRSYDINSLLSVDVGLRLSLFNAETFLFGFEPRIMGRYLYSDRSSVKFSYTRGNQYMQVLNNNSLSYTSNETWFPANKSIDPITVDQVSLGWFTEISDNTMFSLQAYSKWYQNQIDYVDHAVLTFNPEVEDQVVAGKAHSYGVELQVEKTIGRFIGTLGYSYSRAFRTIEDIADGESYSAPHDIPHDLKINVSYRLSERWRANGAWVYTTGRPVTMPIGFYKDDWTEGYTSIVPIYSERNGARMPNYHRLDLGVNYTNYTANKRNYWDLSMGVSNVYDRSNPIGYSFEYYGSVTNLAVFQYSFLSIFPSLSVKYHL